MLERSMYSTYRVKEKEILYKYFLNNVTIPKICLKKDKEGLEIGNFSPCKVLTVLMLYKV
jgi:hypothetical protein